MKDLKLDSHGQFDAADLRHPQAVMKDLGIEYGHSTPQSMYDCWQFWNCKNIPDDLPPWITIHDWNPADFIGNGLSAEMAEKIADQREVKP